MKFLGKFNAEIKEIEDEFRKKFLERKPQEYSSEIGNELLIDVFSERESFVQDEINNDEGWCGDLLLMHKHWRENQSFTISDKESFLKNFSTLSNNAFLGVDWSNMFVAGGSVLAALTTIHGRIEPSYQMTDIDVFIYGLNPEEASKKIFTVLGQINKNVRGSGHVLISQHSVPLLGLFPAKHIQFVLRLYRLSWQQNVS